MDLHGERERLLSEFTAEVGRQPDAPAPRMKVHYRERRVHYEEWKISYEVETDKSMPSMPDAPSQRNG